MQYELKEHEIIVKRGDSPKIYEETAFWHQLKKLFNADGHNMIKKLMWKDGHLTDDTRYYIRSRKIKPTGSIMIYDDNWVFRNVYEPYNKDGEVTLDIVDAYKPPDKA